MWPFLFKLPMLEPIQIIQKYFNKKSFKAFAFQEESWNAYLNGKSGLVNAPTGSGKTFSLALPILAAGSLSNKKGLKAIWITPIRALSQDLEKAISEAAVEMEIDWDIALRTGDTDTKERARQKKQHPDFLITTPESLHIMLASKGYPDLFKNLDCVVIDEWHELIGSKRGVQVELALSRLRGLNPDLKTWGISATIGNLDEAADVLLGISFPENKKVLIKAGIEKKIEVKSIIPDKIEELPWAGHLGIKMIDKVLPLFDLAKTSLVFTNTRSQTEIWYRNLIEKDTDLAGLLAMHHGSLSGEMRSWVESALHQGFLKAVVCTSSLDLGVDFRPVEQVLQIGSPKGIARFLQRAGRSGHQPDAISTIYFVPTHALELMESSCMRKAIEEKIMENRDPFIRAFDVLIQYLVTLAVSEGFNPNEIKKEVSDTFCFSTMNDEEWNKVLSFLIHGGKSLGAYDEFSKLELIGDVYKVTSRKQAMRHRLSIGTIVSDPVIKIKTIKGKYLGSIEEYFMSKLKPGEVFWFAGNCLELIQVKEMTALVRKSDEKKAQIPSWAGGRMPLSGQLSGMLRRELSAFEDGSIKMDDEFRSLIPLLNKQKEISIIPKSNQLLIEQYESKDGFHIFIFPFEGRLVHEGLAGLMNYRIGQWMSISFSIAMNDYGFEMLSDQEIPIEEILGNNVFGTEDLSNDLLNSMNGVEMARRKFRDIAGISGLVFQGFPGKQIQSKHLQASSGLFFDVFKENEPDHLLLQQAYEEVLLQQMEEKRLRLALERIENSEIVIKTIKEPSPFSFPIMVDRLREKMSSESLEDRIAKMQRK
jgi:ATP-dependent helicase Lhr and Lhr-like helicase